MFYLQEIEYRLRLTKGNAIDTGMDHFGAVIGNTRTIGNSVTILPGKHIQASTIVGPRQ